MSLVYAILAVGQNGEFGNDDLVYKGLPFRSVTDMKWFKDFTMGQRLIMSRKTRELVGELPQRVIYTNSREGIHDDSGIPLVLGRAKFDVILAGGARVYTDHLEQTDFVFISIVGSVLRPSTVSFDINKYLEAGFEVIYSGSTPSGQSVDINNLIILFNANSKRFPQGAEHVLSNEIKKKVKAHFHPYLKLKIKDGVTINPGSHGELDISTPVHVPVTQTGIFSLRKALAKQGLYTSGVTFKQGWVGKPTIVVTNNSGSLIELKEGEEIGEIAFLNNQCL